jgi:hypothetical protein
MLIAAWFAFVPLVATASEPTTSEKELLIDKVEGQSIGQFKFNKDSPIVMMMMADLKKANPEATAEVWNDVATEVAAQYTDMLTHKGGMMDQLLRPAMATLTLPELKRLSVVLTDPAYLKYQAAMQSQDIQRSMQQAMMTAGLQIAPMLNQILVKHGLKEVH